MCPTILAMAKAAVAANKPINVTLSAPEMGLCPVILLLKYPKTKRHIVVNKAETIKPFVGESVKK